jgi:hypothetical protein
MSDTLLGTATRFADAYREEPSEELERKLLLARWFARHDPNFKAMGRFACQPYDALHHSCKGLTKREYYVLADFTGRRPF